MRRNGGAPTLGRTSGRQLMNDAVGRGNLQIPSTFIETHDGGGALLGGWVGLGESTSANCISRGVG
jgi:hypothetical protein